MTMRLYLCNKCNRIVDDGDRHTCFFYKNEETVFNLQQSDETEKVDISDETTGKFAKHFNDKNGNTRKTVQKIGNASQNSTSRVHSVISTENKEMDEESLVEHTDSALAQDASFAAPNRKGKLDAGADQPLDLRKVNDTVAGPSTVRHQTIGPDGKRLFVCDECPYRCKYKSKFDVHYRKHTGEKNHVCDFCGRGFVQKGALKSHERTHTGEKPYKCDICEKRFGRKSYLEAHLRMHRGERKYVCKTCGRGFIEKYNLVNHLRTHTGEKPYRCVTCGKSFAWKGSHDWHVKTHTRERPFESPFCGRRFTAESNFRRQDATHNPEPFKCSQCGQSFSSNEDRNRHFMQDHQ